MIGFITGMCVGGLNCVHYDTDSTDLPCCGCVDMCNFEKESEETR